MRYWLSRELAHDQDYYERKHPLDANVFLNGMLIGRVSGLNVQAFVEKLRQMRRALELPPDTSVAWNDTLKEVYVSTEPGILRRPLFVLDTTLPTGEARMRDMVVRVQRVWDSMGRRSSPGFFRELLRLGLVEYLDKMEEQHCLVKADPSTPGEDRMYTHCVLHSLLAYSEMSTSMVFLDRAPTPRATY